MSSDAAAPISSTSVRKLLSEFRGDEGQSLPHTHLLQLDWNLDAYMVRRGSKRNTTALLHLIYASTLKVPRSESPTHSMSSNRLFSEREHWLATCMKMLVLVSCLDKKVCLRTGRETPAAVEACIKASTPSAFSSSSSDSDSPSGSGAAVQSGHSSNFSPSA